MKTFNKSVVALALLVFAAPVFAAEQEGVKCNVLRRTLEAIRKPAAPVVEQPVRNPEGIVARIFAAIRKPADVVPAVEHVQVATPVAVSAQPVVEQVSRNPEGVVARTLAAIRNEVPAVVPTTEQVAAVSVPTVDANITVATEATQKVVQEATKEATQEAAQTTKSWLWSKTGQFVCAMKNVVEPFWMKCQKLQYEATKALDNKYVLAGVSAVATLATAAACYKGFKMYQAYRTNKSLNVAARNKWASAFVIPR